MVENENEDQNKERTKMILNDVLHEIDINENVLEQSEDEDELKLTRKEREAKKKMMKGEMKRKQSHDECIESTHIRFDNDDEKKPKFTRGQKGNQKKDFGGKKFSKPKRYTK